jgi:hypothetical protein
MDPIFDGEMPRARLRANGITIRASTQNHSVRAVTVTWLPSRAFKPGAVLLKHFSQIDDDREPWRVVYPFAEVLLLLTRTTIASCDDFEDIVEWGEHHLDFLRWFSAFHFGIPCVRWLQTLIRAEPK